jgi:hypothetical protein
MPPAWTRRLAALAAALAVGAAPDAAPPPEQQAAFDFSNPAEVWQIWQGEGLTARPCPAGKAPGNGRDCLLIPTAGPGAPGAGVALAGDRGRWHPYTHLRLNIFVPADAPDELQAMVYLKDSDLYFYQHVRKPYLERDTWTEITLDLTGRSDDWEPAGHFKPWDGYCREHVLQFGVRFLGAGGYAGPLCLADVQLLRLPDALPDANAMYNVRPNAVQVGRYDKFELSFNLRRTYDNPFDPEQVDVRGRFVCPDGSVVVVPGFFYQGYTRRMVDGAETLIPTGRSQWKIRFAPRQLGTYHYYLEVDDGQLIRSDMATFRCVEGPNPGFVRVSARDPNYLEFDDGAFYYPIGQNIAAVDDVRARAMGVSIPAEEGTYAYDRFLSKMAANGENFGRVWMSPWSFGIEWTKAYNVHFRGLGRYNLANAWRLDHVVDAAGLHRVYLMLLFTAHGEVGDHESDFRGGDPQHQQGSPYWSRYGGPLASPLGLYTSPEARKFYKRKVRYICARWGYATSIMCWEILNEADLGFQHERDVNAYGPRVADFVRDVIAQIRLGDPARHLTTSGFWAHHNAWAAPTLSLEEMDVFAGHIFDARLGTRLRDDWQFIHDRFGKILLVTEAGLTPFAQSAELTARSIHNTLWSSFMVPMAGAASPWWWVLIENKNLYHQFGALAAYAEGEDRRGRDYQAAPASAVDPAHKRQLEARCLRNADRVFCWVYDPAALSQHAIWEEEQSAPAQLIIPGLTDGEFRVEVWDTTTGKIVSSATIAAAEGRLTIDLPPFPRDIAVKASRAG